MQQTSDIIISDTSCLIILDKIDELELLMKVGHSVYVTPIILEEFGRSLPDWISVASPINTQFQQILELELNQGEASAIALSLDIDNSMLIDRKSTRLNSSHVRISYA